MQKEKLRELQSDFYKKLGEKIRAAREFKKEKQENLANYLGLNRISLVNIESGKHKVPLHTLIAIAGYLDVNLESLIPPFEFKSSAVDVDQFDKAFKHELTELNNKEEAIPGLKEVYRVSMNSIKNLK